jgi:hypothetical protein
MPKDRRLIAIFWAARVPTLPKCAISFGDPRKPAAAVGAFRRARASMPGMMDTVLNLGLNDETVLAARDSGDRALRLMTATAASSRCMPTWCMGVDHHDFEDMLGEFKEENGMNSTPTSPPTSGAS